MKNRKARDFKRFSYFKSEKPKAKENEILIYGPIVDIAFWEDEVTTLDILNKLDEMSDSQEISVRINSPGGIAYDGIAIYNALAEHPAKIKISIDGLAASAASIVAMAGDEITIADNSAIMIHDPWAFVMGSESDLLKEAEVLRTIADGMINTYSARTGIDKEKIRQMMADETWMSAEVAVEEGFADSIRESKQKPSTKADLSVYSKVPEWVKNEFEMEPPPQKAEKKTENPEKGERKSVGELELNINAGDFNAKELADAIINEMHKAGFPSKEFQISMKGTAPEGKAAEQDDEEQEKIKFEIRKKRLKLEELEI